MYIDTNEVDVQTRERLEQLLAGEISVIEELEEDILPDSIFTRGTLNNWAFNASVNRI